MMLNRVSLNTIGLNRIGLNRIGKPSRGSSERPYIDPEVLASLKAVCICYGKSNDDPDRAIVKNLVDPDNPFVISNAAFKLNSGFGKYEVDFTVHDNQNVLVSPNKLVSIAGKEIISLISYAKLSKDIPSYKVKITGLDGEISYWYRNQDGTESRITITEDGIYQLPVSYNVEEGAGTKNGFNGYSESSCTIEQIPSFEGAFVTDGIDDLITSTKSATEMLDGSNEITVVSMIHQIKTNSDATRNNWFFTPVSYLENRVVENKTGKTGIYGYTSTNVTNAQISDITPILGDKNDYTLYSKIEDGDRDYFTVEGFQNQGIWYVSSIAWYWTIIANKVLTTDQINQVIAYFNLDRTLKPDILCDVKKQGITNENHAEFGDKLIDFSGNGRDIQLNNIAWKGDSGIGKYETELSNTSIWTKGKETTSSPFSSSYNGLSGWIVFANTELTNSADMPSFKIQVKGLLEGQELIYRYYDSNGQSNVYSMGKDGEYTLPSDVRTAKPQTSNTSGFQVVKNETNIITITQIPSHAGALCLDGVNDFGKVTGMPIYKDYTFIIDYERISYASSEKWVAGAVSKSHVANQGAFILMTANTEVEPAKQAYSFGGVTSFNRDDFTRALLYQSKYKCGDVDLTVGEGVDSDTLWLGTFRDNDQRFFNGAIYSLMSFPYSMSEFLIERQLKKHKLGTLYPNMVEFRPVIKSNASYDNIEFYYKNEKVENGTYLTVGSSIGMHIRLSSSPVNEIKSITVNGIPATFKYHDANNNIYQYDFNLTSKSPQNINITIDEYIRYEDIVQPYPVLLRFNDENGNEVSWGGKFRVGSTITRIGSFYENNLLDGLYVVRNPKLNGNNLITPTHVVEKSMVFTCDTEYLLDNNEPKCILSPSRLRIPNSSYKILGYIPDISGHGNHGVIHNSAYAGASGANGYLQNFSGWTKASGVSSTDSVISSSNNLVAANGWIAYVTSGTVIPTFKVEISGIPINGNLRFEGSDQTLVNGVNTIQGLTTTKVSGFYISNGYDNDWSNLRIEQIGEYEGAYCLDGVDDFVTIPTLSSGGKQVLMKVNWQSSIAQAMLYDQRGTDFAIWNSDKFNDNEVDTVPAYSARNGGNTYIDGILNKNILASQLRNITHNIVSTNNMVNGNSVSPNIGCALSNSYYSQMALYDFMLFENISTDDKIKELNEYVGIEAKVELPPYYWDAYGKTNLDVDKTTIQQRGVAEGDYDLTNNNLAYDKMSGYGGYEFAKFDNVLDWYLTPNNNHIDVVSRNGYEITLKNLSTSVDGWYFQNSRVIGFITRDIPFKVKANKSIRVYWDMHSYKISSGEAFGHVVSITTLNPNEDTSISLRHLTEEELVELDTNKDRMYYLLWFDLSTLAVNEEVTIEMLPLYPNGLVYDAVTDYSKNSDIPALDDFTAIMKRKWLKKQGCPLIKGSKVYEGGNGNALLFEWDKAYNFVFYKRTDIIEGELPDNISFITPTNYNGNVITRGSEQDTNGICIAGDGNAGFANMVFYKLILYPKTIPLLQINFLKNMMERDEIIDLTNPIFIQE